MSKAGKQTIRGKLLTDVAALTNDARNKTHGDPIEQHRIAANLWNAYLEGRGIVTERELDGRDVCQLIILLKTSRQITGDPTHGDHYMDQAGYAAISHEIVVSGEITQ